MGLTRRHSELEKIPSLEAEDDAYFNRVSLQEAIARNFKIVINLTWPLGNHLYHTFGRATDINQMGTQHHQFKKNNAHASLTANSMQELYDAFERIKAEEQKALMITRLLPPVMPRTVVSHARDVRYVDNFIIGASPHKHKHLVSEMEKRGKRFMDLGRTDVQNFPQFFTYDGQPVLIAASGDAKLFVNHKFKSDDGAFTPDFEAGKSYDVLAMPTLRIGDAQAARAEFAAGGTGTIDLYWQVNSDSQYQPAQNAMLLVPAHLQPVL